MVVEGKIGMGSDHNQSASLYQGLMRFVGHQSLTPGLSKFQANLN
jgi:hypothetical protein